jgi:2-amino-4-hydroxy-6-hydroxymethyldihydropteridine diphosphokinase
VRTPEIAFVALGSNLGNSVEIIQSAVEELRGLSAKPPLKSSLWQSAPVDCPPGSPPFINAVVGLIPRPGLTPAGFLRKLRALEKKFGRTRSEIRNEPRFLDLDLIAFGGRAWHSKNLILPHPRAHLRRFVLEPLSEIAPDFVLPGQTKSVKKLLPALKNKEHLSQL